jgi:hypothetical protein
VINTYRIVFLLFTLVVCSQMTSHGQTIVVNGIQENTAREWQLLEKWNSNHSFAVRPIKVNPDQSKTDSNFHWFDLKPIVWQSKATSFGLHPLKLESNFNSTRPYGWNNGSMLQSRGPGTRLSMGLHYASGPFEVNVQPEWVYAANSNYTTTTLYGMPNDGPYHRIFAGQSYANLNLGKIKLGYSNQNLWWGPGQFSALLMSNNAPGFGHFHFSSREPIHTKLFDLEWQLIGGGLSQDSTINAENHAQQKGIYTPQWRYVNAMVISIHPNFLKGLHLGFTRSLQVYQTWFQNKDISMFEKYMPMLSQFFKKKIYTQANAPLFDDGKDQLASVFIRFVMPRSHFEFYFEYGYNDFKTNVRDLAIDAQHSSAYIVGFKKVIPKNNDRYFSISGEITQMAQPPDFVVRNAGNWYVHNTVKQGMTHMNQLLGAGSGLGNNVQTLQLESVKGQNRLGFKIQRIQNDPRKQTLGVRNIWIVPIQWTDFTYGPIFHHQWKKISATGEMQMVHSKNYGWTPQTKFNLFTALSLAYRW